ncbi:MAG: Gfo/Idh/MocA family oxidoreductase [Spirochaetaceae bacterium]|nr:Gfo/Idh/MocA family oxidoreductase [Spirochaetaceae bacterium]
MKKIKWGIIGAGIIAEKMAAALKIVPDCELAAVASKSPERAAAFADKYRAVRACSYDEIVSDENIDVIYVATIHNYHYQCARLALENGKHVLVEKPFTVNAAEAEALAALASERNLFLMEAMWVRFLPVQQRLKTILREGRIGDIRQITVSFGKFISPQFEKRLKDPELAGGATLDLGIYPISFLSFLLGELPSEINSMCRFSESGVDEIADYTFRYPSGCIGQICTSYNLLMNDTVLIYGTKGWVEYPGFPKGNQFTLRIHDGTNDVISDEVFSEKHQENGFVYQVGEVVRCLRAGKTKSSVMPLEDSVGLMKVMDRVRKDWGLKYSWE